MYISVYNSWIGTKLHKLMSSILTKHYGRYLSGAPIFGLPLKSSAWLNTGMILHRDLLLV